MRELPLKYAFTHMLEHWSIIGTKDDCYIVNGITSNSTLYLTKQYVHEIVGFTDKHEKNMNDVMIDFEALGKDCPCQIGAIYFDRVTGELGQSYQANIDATTLVVPPDAKTTYWWLEQSKEAQNTLLTNKQDIRNVLANLVEFLTPAKRIWSHATYDFVMLQKLLNQYNIPNSISYKSGLDIRTLIYLAGTSTKDIVREGTHHNALEDCKYQVKYVTKALNELKINKSIVNFINKVQERE